MNEKQLQKLIKKTTAKAEQKQKQPKRLYDATLDATKTKATEEQVGDADDLFKEMKRREF
jgi:hypothetical protein